MAISPQTNSFPLKNYAHLILEHIYGHFSRDMAIFQSSWLLETLFLLKHYGHISKKIMVISLQSTWLFEISWSFLQKQYSNFSYNTEIISNQTWWSFLRKHYDNFLSNIVVIFKRLWSYLVKHGHFSSIIMAIWNIMVFFLTLWLYFSSNTLVISPEMVISPKTLWSFFHKINSSMISFHQTPGSFLPKHQGNFSSTVVIIAISPETLRSS